MTHRWPMTADPAMLGRAAYREGWEWKKAWYEKNGFVLGQNLFTTRTMSVTGSTLLP